MEWRRVKNLTILILLIVNAALLILVIARRNESLRYEQSALARTISVLEQNEIALSERDILSKTGVQPRMTERSVSGEQVMVSALLKEDVEGENLGGGLYTYRTGRGQVSFRAGGELSCVLNEDPRWAADNPAAHARELLEDMRVKAELIHSEVTDGSEVLVFRQSLNGAPVFSCLVTFYYENGQLTTILGNLLTPGSVSVDAVELLSLPTALMRFLEDVVEKGDVCSAILSVESGYRSMQSFAGTVQLAPTWFISTNTTDYYVDGVTGEVSRAVRSI